MQMSTTEEFKYIYKKKDVMKNVVYLFFCHDVFILNMFLHLLSVNSRKFLWIHLFIWYIGTYNKYTSKQKFFE